MQCPLRYFFGLVDRAVHNKDVKSDEEPQSLRGDNVLAGKTDSSPLVFNAMSLKWNGFDKLDPARLVDTR